MGPLTTDEIENQHLFDDQAPSRDSKRWCDRRSTKTGFKRKRPGDTHMSRSCTGSLLGIPGWQTPLHSETRWRPPSPCVAWGSRFNNGADQRASFGAEAQTSDLESDKTVLWLSPFPKKPPLALRTIVRSDTFDNTGTAKPGGSRVQTYPWRCNDSESKNARYWTPTLKRVWE